MSSITDCPELSSRPPLSSPHRYSALLSPGLCPRCVLRLCSPSCPCSCPAEPSPPSVTVSWSPRAAFFHLTILSSQSGHRCALHLPGSPGLSGGTSGGRHSEATLEKVTGEAGILSTENGVPHRDVTRSAAFNEWWSFSLSSVSRGFSPSSSCLGGCCL